MKTLTIKLTSPLQSFGNDALYNYRTSYRLPSKSMVTGMIAAALGYDRNNPKIENLNSLLFAVRVDQPGYILKDYQTVEWEPGKRKITHRTYYQDAIYLVALTGDNRRIDQIDYALHHPKFQLYIGRRSNPPAGVLETKVYDEDNPISVLKDAPWVASKRFKKRSQHENGYEAEIMGDAKAALGRPTFTIKDVYQCGPHDRQHGYRYVVKDYVVFGKNDENETEQDIFSLL